MTALVLSIALSLTLACPAADAATPAGEAAMPAANDPLGVIALADALGSEGRNDEALAVLRSALDTPALVSEASDRLTRLLVRSPPRRAWALGYGSAAALDGDNDLLKRIVAQSMLQDPSPRVRVEGARTLDALRQASPEDEAGRIAAGDAWLRLGRPDQAMEAYGAGGGKKLSQRRAAALLAMGRYKRAAENAPRAVPEACRVAATPVACALGLADMGFPGAAAGRLERELRNRHPTLRSRAQRAAGYGTLGALHVRSGQPDRAIRAWQDSMANQPSEDVRRKLVDALLASGRVGTARRYVDLDDPCIERGDCPARAVKAVVAALSVDVSGDGPAVARAIGEAERLDRDQPIVARRAARFHLERDRPEAALGLLEPLLRSQADDEAFLRLYSRVAMALDRPALAVDAWRAGMAAARTPKPFARRLVRYADHQVRAAEASKDAGRSEDARVRYMLALTPSPGDGDRLCGLGGALWAGGRMEQAENAYRTVLEQEADNPVALRSLVLLLQGRGDLAGARQLLESHDLDHPRLTHLSHELRSLARAVEVASLREAGSTAEALARVEALLADGPNDVRLLKLRADLLGELGRHVDAAETYRMARSVDTMDDPYITLGEVYALLAIQQVDEARALIDTVSFAGPAGADARAAERAVERGEAAIALAEGRDSDAMAIYIQLLEADRNDPATAESLSEAYASRGQLGPALAWNAQARSVRSKDQGLRARYVELLVSAGQLGQAQRMALALSAEAPSAEHLSLSRSVAQALVVQRAAGAASAGELEQAERLLRDQLDAEPDNATLLVAWARLKVEQDEPEEAWDVLHKRVLAADPVHPGALAAVAGIGLGNDRAADAVETWQEAVSAGAPSWVSAELRTLELASRLAEARERHARGLQVSADDIVAEAERWYGTADPRHQTMLGEAWMAIERPERAIGAFEIARRQARSASASALGLSRALVAVGEPAAAESVLADQWTAYGAPEVGAALVILQRNRGRLASARGIVAELRSPAGENPPARDGYRSTPARLKVIALPDGTVPADDLHPVGPPSFSPPPGADAVARTAAGPWLSVQSGFGYAGRPGVAGRSFMQAITVPVAAEADLGGAVRLHGEIVPVRVSDGEREESGTGGSLAALFALGGLTGEARIGRSPAGFTVVPAYSTYKFALATQLGRGLGLGLEASRAPVTDSVAAWAGATDATGALFGGARDSWVGADFGWGGAEGQNIGIIGRVGHAEALGATPDIPWRQGYAYGRTRLTEGDNQQLWLGASGTVLDHERQVDGFRSGEAGMFSPELFWSALGRVEGIWGLDEGTWTVCASAGAGPMQVVGDQTLYLGPGTYAAYQLHGAVKMALADDWTIHAHGDHQGSLGTWSQTTGMLQLRYGRIGGSPLSPSATVGSPIHGPPMAPSTQCGSEWAGWTP